MGKQIIRQPDGRYSIWSSIVDALVMVDCTRKDVLSYFATEAAADARARVGALLAHIDAGKRAYYQFTKSWEDVRKEYEQAQKPRRRSRKRV